MENRIVTPGRLTVMMPVVTMPHAQIEEQKRAAMVRLDELTMELGRQLVHNILVKKGKTYIMNKNGTRLKPIAQTIFAKGMQRLASNESPETIVSDLQAQLLLIKGPH